MTTEKFARYEIRSELGRGGMATVYHGYDPVFERDVAIKVLPQAMLHDPQFRTRFTREAKMIALIEHPAIVPVYDFGEESGQPFIVMRYMSGGSLSERMEKGALSLDETVQIINRLAPALDAAHAKSIIHRDLKPGNVLFDQYGNAFLSDFGIARGIQSSGATLTGQAILGTPAYMSPEQIQGEKNLDGRSDMYSLGVMIFQMLTGQLPYQAETPAKVMMMHVLHPVPDLSQLSPNMPEGLKILINKSMAKNPADRFSTCSELSTMLSGIVHGEAVIDADTGAVVVSVAKAQPSASRAETVVARPRRAAEATRKVSGAAVAAEAAMPAARPRSAAPIIGGVIALVAIAGVAVVLAFLGMQGKGPLAMLGPATATLTQVATQVPPSPSIEVKATETEVESSVGQPTTETPPTEASPTPTETLVPTPSTLIIGGADKIAWVDNNDIYIANLDGTEIKRLTEDGTTKMGLQWTPDGQAVNFISGKCVFTVNIETTKVDIIVCFNFVDYFKSFEISPDGTKVALSLDNQLYIVPYDLARLGAIKTRGGLTEIAECKDYAPWLKYFVKYARWSTDGTNLAMIIMGVASGIGSADIIHVIPVTECTPSPPPIDNFPPPRFRMPAYEKSPAILNFGWDGLFLFVFNTLVRNNGFGDLYIYNMDLHKARMELNPIGNACCYRDASWSPDGTHLLLAFQDYALGPSGLIEFYLIPYGTIGTGVSYSPLPLPPIGNINSSPVPVLRPVR